MEKYRKEAGTKVKKQYKNEAKKLRATTFAPSKFEAKSDNINNFCYRKVVPSKNIWEAIEKRKSLSPVSTWYLHNRLIEKPF